MSTVGACIVRCDVVGCGSELPMLARSDAQAIGWEIASRPAPFGRTDVTDHCPIHTLGSPGETR